MDLSKKNTYIILSAILIFTFILNINTFKTGHNWGGDFAGYINQAKSLVDGTIDELVSTEKYLIENSTREAGTIFGSLGFSILLTPVYYFFDLNIYAMKIVVNLFFVLSLFAVFLLFRDRLSNLHSLLLVLIIAVNTWFFEFKDEVLTDIPFLFFSLFSLFLIKRFIILKEVWINKIVSYSLIGIFIFLSSNIRSIGLVLLPTLFVVQYIESRSSITKKFSMMLEKYNYVPYIVFIILTAITNSISPDTAISNYLNILFTQKYSNIVADLTYLSLLPSRFFPFLFLNMNVYGFSYNKFSLVIYCIIVLVVIWGMIKNIKKDYMFVFYTLFSLIITYLFSYRGGERLIVPIFPFFLFFLFLGLSRAALLIDVSDKYNPFKIRADYIFAFGMILISLFYTAKVCYQNIVFNRTEQVIDGPYSHDSVELFDYIKANTGDNEAVIFYKPRVMALYTGRKSAYIHELDKILNSNAEYIVCDKAGGQYITSDKEGKLFKLTGQDFRDNFNCIFENNTFILCSLGNVSHRQYIQQ